MNPWWLFHKGSKHEGVFIIILWYKMSGNHTVHLVGIEYRDLRLLPLSLLFLFYILPSLFLFVFTTFISLSYLDLSFIQCLNSVPLSTVRRLGGRPSRDALGPGPSYVCLCLSCWWPALPKTEAVDYELLTHLIWLVDTGTPHNTLLMEHTKFVCQSRGRVLTCWELSYIGPEWWRK
jgi:hypothetical protein